MSVKAKAIKNLYIRGKIDIEGLKKSVRDGVITEEEYFEISGARYGE